MNILSLPGLWVNLLVAFTGTASVAFADATLDDLLQQVMKQKYFRLICLILGHVSLI